jgi:ABC-type phosphate transport system substrate-binding protein
MIHKLFIVIIILSLQLWGRELFIIAHKDFPSQNINRSTLKAIFLDKKRFINQQKILPLNYNFNNLLRICFEKKILKKNRRSLERYWLQAHYHGKRPPKVIKSEKMVLEYLQKIPGSIGYIDAHTKIDNRFKILLRVYCK